MMRISTNYIYQNSNRYIQDSINNLLHTQEIMASQRKINHLSDDPVSAGRILDADSYISKQDQYVRNINNGTTFSGLYDNSMDTVNNLLSRAKQLLVQEANSASSTAQTREAARVEIVSLASQLVSVGNLQYGNSYLYAGYADNNPPFQDITANVAPPAIAGRAATTYTKVSDPALVTNDAYQINFTAANTFDVVDTTKGTTVLSNQTYTSGGNITFDGITLRLTDTPGAPQAGDTYAITVTPAGTYAGDSGVVSLEIEPNTFQQVNFTGDRVFQGVGVANGVNLFDIFQRANVALRNNDQVEINNLLQEFDKGTEQISDMQSLAGSRSNLLSNTSSRLQDIKTNIQSLRSDLRDADVTSAVTDLNRQQNAYQAILTATAKTITPNLLDFLR